MNQFDNDDPMFSSDLYVDHKNNIYVINRVKKKVFISTETSSLSIDYSSYTNVFIHESENFEMTSCSFKYPGSSSYLPAFYPNYFSQFNEDCSTSFNCSKATEELFFPTGIYIHLHYGVYVVDTSIRNLCNDKPLHQVILQLGTRLTIVKLLLPKLALTDDLTNVLVANPVLNMILHFNYSVCSCIVGCSSKGPQVQRPSRFWSDDYGNILILDSGGSRVQKLQFDEKSFCK